MTYQEWRDWKAGEAAAGYENDDAATLKFFGADARDGLQSIVKRRTMKLKNGFACFPDNDVLGEFYDIALVQRPLQHSSAAVTQALYWHWIAEN